MDYAEIRKMLLGSYIGRAIFKIYHYVIAVPRAKKLQKNYERRKHDYSDIHFMKDIDTLNMIADGKSFARFGDGEILWIYREAKGYFAQENSIELANRLKEVLTQEDDRVLIGIPSYFSNMEEFTDAVKNSRAVHLAEWEGKWKVLLNSDYIYADSLITRAYSGRKKSLNFETRFNAWKKIWKDKDVLIIEGSRTRFGVGNNLLDGAKTVYRLICPAENAFSKYDEILTKAMNYIKNKITLIALGPTATVLAYDIAKKAGGGARNRYRPFRYRI